MRPIRFLALLLVLAGLALGVDAQAPVSPADLAKADVNDDQVVDNADLAIVRAVYGKRFGQAGYLPAADMDGNNTITVADISFVQRLLGRRVPPAIHINEIDSNPADFVELINVGTTTANLSGWSLRDNDDTHIYVIPAGTTVAPGGYLVVEDPLLGFGLGAADSVRLFDDSGYPFESYSWTAHAATSYGRCPNGTGGFVTTTAVTKGAVNDCTSPVKINEIESSADAGGPDWVELHNPSSTPADISGFIFRDNDNTHTYTVPAGTIVTPGGYYVIEDATFGFGLGSGDSARLFDSGGALRDSYTWTAHATVTYGRCPNGTGAFGNTFAATKGAANSCTAPVTTVHINEIESNPTDWIEFINTGATPADVSGWSIRDNDDTHIYVLPAGTIVAAGGYLVVDDPPLGFGLGSTDSVRFFNGSGVLFESYSWAGGHAATTYGRCPNGTGAFAVTASATKGAANACGGSAPIEVKINEVESSDPTPGPDWVELFNPAALSADLSGVVLKDNDDTHIYTFPAGTTLAAGAYLVVEDPPLGFGLGSADSARLFSSTGTLLDSYTWAAHATTTYGRCANGTGAFTTTTSATKGAVNACPGDPLVWPGSASVATADALNVLGGNMSGLVYERPDGLSPVNVLWAVKNGPGTLYRLLFDGVGTWNPDPAGGWSAGRALKYPSGAGNPDAEGVTFAGTGSAAGIYVATERDNDVNSISRNSILRFDPLAAGATLMATNEWNITGQLPANGANLGIEAITWIPDTFLQTNGFIDDAAGGAVYNPASYPNHGEGLFFVGVEASGSIHAFALNHATNTATLVTTIVSTMPGVMDLLFDRELLQLWAICDDTCQGRSTVFTISAGRFTVKQAFARPASMPNLNNEGFTFTPLAECSANERPVFWSDDSNTDGHAIRSGTVTCAPF